MEIVRIFDDKDTFWCVSYPEDNGDDILDVLFSQWSDTEYLMNFFTENIKDLQTIEWHGISVDKAVSMVKDEARFLEDKLVCIEFKEQPECVGDVKVNDIFKPFKKYQYVINNYAEDHFVKGKLETKPQFLRLYGVQLDDGAIIISGGAIKLTSGLYTKHLRREVEKLHILFNYLEDKGIANIQQIGK